MSWFVGDDSAYSRESKSWVQFHYYHIEMLQCHASLLKVFPLLIVSLMFTQLCMTQTYL